MPTTVLRAPPPDFQTLRRTYKFFRMYFMKENYRSVYLALHTMRFIDLHTNYLQDPSSVCSKIQSLYFCTSV